MYNYFDKCTELLKIILTFFSTTNTLLLTIIFFNFITDIKKINCDYLFINILLLIFTIIFFIINLLFLNEYNNNNKYYKFFNYILSLVIGLIFYSTLIIFVDNRYICRNKYDELNLKEVFDYLLLLSGLIHIFDMFFMFNNVLKNRYTSMYTSI